MEKLLTDNAKEIVEAIKIATKRRIQEVIRKNCKFLIFP